MKTETKAVQIPASVKEQVFKRDNGRCVYCGSSQAAPVAHYIPRSHGGLGIEENILTLCSMCHYKYDHTDNHTIMKVYFRRYLAAQYPDWNEEKLIYKKY